MVKSRLSPVLGIGDIVGCPRTGEDVPLEMVTDQERDYLWSTYAADRRARLNLGIRRRLAPLLCLGP